MTRHLIGYRSAFDDDDEYAPRSHRLLGWSIGTVMGTETLVQSRPIVRGDDIDPIDDLLRTPAGCTVAVFSSGRRDDETPRDIVRTARFRRWVAVEAHTSLDERCRDALLASLPDFLSRDAHGRTDGEVLLLRFLAAMHRRGAFAKALAAPQDLRDALKELQEVVGPHSDAERGFNFFVSDGRTLGIIHEGGTLLAFSPPPEVRPAREFRVAPGTSSGPLASMLLWRSAAPPEQPEAGAERLAAGIYSVSAAAPGNFVREN